MTYVKLTILFLFIFCSSFYAQDDSCARTGHFGETPFCLPLIDGWNECYTLPLVKERADATEAPTNSVLGYYICDSNYVHINDFENLDLDNFFKVYGTNELQSLDVDTNYLLEIEKLFNTNFFEENWEEITEATEEILEDMTIGVPKGIENYKLNSDSFTSIMLLKYNLEGYGSFTMAMACNGLLINDRLIWLAYYLSYEDDKTIEMLKLNNEKIVNAFLMNNNK